MTAAGQCNMVNEVRGLNHICDFRLFFYIRASDLTIEIILQQNIIRNDVVT